MEPTTGFEPVTPSLPRKCSTPEPRGRSTGGSGDPSSDPESLRWSGKRDSNPRPSAWKADALPTELLPLFVVEFVHLVGSTWWGEEDSNLRSLRRQIYSLLPLSTRASPRPAVRRFFTFLVDFSFFRRTFSRLPPWSWRRDLNPRPADYKSAALPAELRQLGENGNHTKFKILTQDFTKKFQFFFVSRRCRTASNRTTAAAAATLRDSVPSPIGIRTVASQFRLTSGRNPRPSPPRTTATPSR